MSMTKSILRLENSTLAFILGLMIFCPTAMADTVFKIIELKHRMAQDIIPTVQALVGSDGVVSGLNNQLIIRTNSARMTEVEQTVAALDSARRNIKITVSHDAMNQSQQDNASAQGNVKIGKVIVGNDRRLPFNSAQINVERNISHSNEHGSQFINTLEGERAFIRSGQIVPYTQEWVTLTRQYAQVRKTTEFRDISTGFAVRPRRIGAEDSNDYEIEITPRIASLNSSGYIDFEELTTSVRVHKGEWLDLGGIMLSHDDVSRKILSSQNQSSQRNSNLMIRID